MKLYTEAMFSAKPETEEGKRDIALALANRSAVLIKVKTKLLEYRVMEKVCRVVYLITLSDRLSVRLSEIKWGMREFSASI